MGITVKDSSGNAIASYEYTYDINGNRIAKSVDNNGDGTAELIERYVLDGNEIALVFDGAGNQTERFFYGTGIDEVLAVEEPDTVYWNLSDQQGTVRVLLDDGGEVVNQISYDAFGNITNQSDSSVDFRFTYTGRELDEETGQYYYRVRYYDPMTGRFINEDLIGMNGGDTNLYRYVGNSPTLYIDPYGESLLNNLDRASAGFGDAVTFGGTTWLRSKLYGDLATRNHQGGYFVAGQLTGTGVTTFLGYGVQGNAAKLSPALVKTVQAYDGLNTVADVVGGVRDGYQSLQNVLQNCGDWTDWGNLLNAGMELTSVGRNARAIGEIGDGLKSSRRAKNANLRSQTRGNDTASEILNCTSSFVAGTEVLTPDGLVNIEDIEVGDWVISDDPETEGEIIAKQVTRTFVRSDNNGIYDVEIDGEVISSTYNHQFYILDKQLVGLENLVAGDELIFDNPDTEGIIESKELLGIEIKEDGNYELNLDGELVTGEEQEQFWIRDIQWVEAKDLEEGDLLWTEDGDFVEVDGIGVREGSFEVFNFEVEDFHTYFVSQNGVLVHNVNCDATHFNDFSKLAENTETIHGKVLPKYIKGKDKFGKTYGILESNDLLNTVFADSSVQVASAGGLTKRGRNFLDANIEQLKSLRLINPSLGDKDPVQISLKHAEGFAAAILRNNKNIKEATLTINRDYVCNFCKNSVEKILNKGQKLNVKIKGTNKVIPFTGR